ncbi:hypothetical protein [uncultured Algibacter sp.]|uniref:hypothetical protein n=1 Tax=uncultured Algibacter sp. TaxID=298659 RepID=UPI0026266AB2|nr:hypothetical protein [uncultured Algibacter sp.]
MSFGVVQSAIATIKNNRNLLSNRKRLKNTLSSEKHEKYETKASNYNTLSLKKLKNRLQNEHKQIRIKQLIIFGIMMLILISVFIYYI